jgi:hypothetical protein
LAPSAESERQVRKGRGIIKRFACFVLVAVIVAASATAMMPAPIPSRSTAAAPVTFTATALPLDSDALDSALMSSQGFGAEIADAVAAATDSDALDAYNSFVDGFAELLGVLDVALLLPTLGGGLPASLVGDILVYYLIDVPLSVVVLSAADLLLGFPVPFPVDISSAPAPIGPGEPSFDSTTTLDGAADADTAMPGTSFDVDPLPDLSTPADLGQEASDTLLNLLP